MKIVDSETFHYNDDDVLHRTDGPAVITGEGSVEYWVDDKLHRTDGPAIVWIDGSVEYWVNNELQHKDSRPYQFINRT